MASFMEDLWQSIFTPGPTSTLVIATNVTFAALQLVLFALLIATYSIHFIVLSVLCAGLWVSINWFAKEVQLAQAAQDKVKQDEAKRAGRPGASNNEDASEAKDKASVPGEVRTELESSEGQSTSKHRSKGGVLPNTSHETDLVDRVAVSSGSSHVRAPSGTLDNLKLRSGKSLAGSTGDLSASGTDSEWEKVEGDK